MAEDKKEGMKQNLATLENVLWKQFSGAVEAQSQYENPSSSGNGAYGSPQNFSIENRKAIAALGSVLLAVSRERRVIGNAEDAAEEKSWKIPLPPGGR